MSKQGGRVQLKKVDMEGGMRNDAINIAARGVELFSQCGEIAGYIKAEFDRMYESPWQCFVSKGGASGFSVTNNSGHYVYFKIDDYWVTLYRTRLQGN